MPLRGGLSGGVATITPPTASRSTASRSTAATATRVFGNQFRTYAQIQFLGHFCPERVRGGNAGSPLGRQAQVKLGNRARK